jgi:hypothetical protein
MSTKSQFNAFDFTGSQKGSSVTSSPAAGNEIAGVLLPSVQTDNVLHNSSFSGVMAVGLNCNNAPRATRHNTHMTEQCMFNPRPLHCSKNGSAFVNKQKESESGPKNPDIEKRWASHR